MSSYEIELTNKCNALCPGCPRTDDNGDKHPNLIIKEITLEQFKKIFPPDKCKRANFNFCGLSGDPMAAKDFLKIIQYVVSSSSSWVEVTTNGSLGSKHTWETMAKLNDGNLHTRIHVNFSVDGLENTNHLYRVDVPWNKVVRNMTIWSENSRPDHASWKFIDFGYNHDDIPIIKERCASLGFNFSSVVSSR